jgi:acetyl-CoA carboxylase carboxyl transferase subunit alpha
MIDDIVPEPDGGAHNDHDLAASMLENSLAKHLAELKSQSIAQLIERRYEKFRNIGKFFSEQG